LAGHHHHGHHHHGYHRHGHSHDDGHVVDPCPDNNPGGEPGASTPNVPARPSNHDDDALYVSGELGLNLAQAVEVVANMGLVHWGESDQSPAIDASAFVDVFPHFLVRGDVPIYLITL